MIKKLAFAFFAAVLLAMGVTGCNTVRGAGQDIENTGEAIDRNL